MCENHHSSLLTFKVSREAAASATGNLTEMQILWPHSALPTVWGEGQQSVDYQAFQVIVIPLRRTAVLIGKGRYMAVEDAPGGNGEIIRKV